MRSKFKWIFTLLVALTMQLSFAQDKTVTGVVQDDKGPIAGANVKVQGTDKKAQTGFDGKYSIKAKQGDVLVFSFVGYDETKIKVGNGDVINASLKSEKELTEVIVTAQNFKKDKRTLGITTSTLSSSQLNGKPQTDVVRSMQGKIAGVQITNNGGLAGQASNIVIRGNKSITGSSNPLYIIDGVPFDTSNSDISGSFASGAASSTNRSVDIDPENIESMSVLKGLAAAVTYGAQGRNGVILITTKSGRKNQAMKVDISNSIFVSEIANLPEYTDKYTVGNNNTTATGNVGNWGAPTDPNVLIPHMYDQSHLNGIFPEYIGVTTPNVAVKNNVKDFFRKGFASQTNVNISGGTEKIIYSFNASYADEDGIVSHNNVTKYNMGGKIDAQMSDKFRIKTSLNFFNTKYATPFVGAGAGSISIFERLLYIPRNFDIMNLPYQNPLTGASVNYRTDYENPRWVLENTRNTSVVNRFFGVFEPSYQITKGINVTYRLGFDRFNDEQNTYVNKGAVQAPYNLGYLRTYNNSNTIIDQSLLIRNKTIKITDKLSLDPLLGFNARRAASSSNGISSQGQILFNTQDHRYFSTSSNTDPDAGDLYSPEQWSNTLGVFATADLTYSNYLYLNLSVRKDWFSSLERSNNSIAYPGAALSFIPSALSDVFQKAKIDMWKLRASYGTSAGFPGLYNTKDRSYFNANQNISGNQTINQSDVTGNPDLKPEIHRELEFGTELDMFNKRVRLDLSVYYRTSKDQIVSRQTDPSQGGTRYTFNAGQIDNRGIEGNLTLIPLKSNNFEWAVTGIFTKNKSEVVELPEGQDNIYIAGYGNSVGNFAVKGEQYGVIMGTYALKDSNGNYLINPTNGTLLSNNQVGLANKIIGDPNPDYTLSVNNSFTYKGFNLGFLFEFTKGGDFYSATIENLLRRGVTRDTENGRFETYIINGVYGSPTDGSVILSGGQPIQNNIQISANNLYFLNFVDPDSQNIYDATRLRLRELNFGYTLPAKFLKGTGLNGISFNIVGNNLWLKAFNIPKYTNVDPELISTGGRGLGLDFQTAPQSRRYGFNIKINF